METEKPPNILIVTSDPITNSAFKAGTNAIKEHNIMLPSPENVTTRHLKDLLTDLAGELTLAIHPEDIHILPKLADTLLSIAEQGLNIIILSNRNRLRELTVPETLTRYVIDNRNILTINDIMGAIQAQKTNTAKSN